MEDVLTLTIIAILVSVGAPLLAKHRNFYFVAVAVMLGGLLIGVWGHKNSKIGYEDYVRMDVEIQRSEFNESDELLKFYINGDDYILPRSNISDFQRDAVRQDGPKLNGAATIWLHPNAERIVTGISTPDLVIDPQPVAEMEKELYAKFRNVGIGMSAPGLVLVIFNFFTPPKKEKLRFRL